MYLERLKKLVNVDQPRMEDLAAKFQVPNRRIYTGDLLVHIFFSNFRNLATRETDKNYKF